MNSNSKSKQLNEMIQISKALSNPIRIEILNLVKDRISLNQTELSIHLNMNLSHVHTHVASLRRSNLITLDLNDEKLNEYSQWLNKFAS